VAVVADEPGELLLFGLELDTGLPEYEPRDALGDCGGPLVVRRRLPRVGKHVSVVGTQQQQVGVAGVNTAQARLAARHRLRAEVLEPLGGVPERQDEPRQSVPLGFEAASHAADENLHVVTVPYWVVCDACADGAMQPRYRPALAAGSSGNGELLWTT